MQTEVFQIHAKEMSPNAGNWGKYKPQIVWRG